ncbi:MAG: class I SAM-dependent RNA methyltransferase [Bacteroidia bacterium]
MLYTFSQEGDFEMKATTFFGMEELLRQEILKLGGKNIEVFNRGVSFTGDLGFLYKANLCLRTALKVLIPIHSFKVYSEDDLYNKLKEVPWNDYFNYQNTFKIESVLNSDLFSHSLYVAQKAKDAIVDKFRERYNKRPSVDLIDPDFKIYIHLYKNELTISLDSSGDLLNRRGYRVDRGKAPMNEILAAALVLQSNWQPHQQLIDGMSGSGTIAIEAALIGNNVPPGVFRNKYGFMKWKNYNEELFQLIFDACLNKIKDNELKIVAVEKDALMIPKIKANIKSAKLLDVIEIVNQDFFDYKPVKLSGVMIINPPYGERLNDTEIESLYKKLGDKLKQDFKGLTCWLITSSNAGKKSIGLHASKTHTLFNGNLECKFLKYELYEGSKKQSKSNSGN